MRSCPLLLLIACSSSESPRVEPAAPPPPLVLDAGREAVTEVEPFDPSSGLHLDDDGRRTVTSGDRSRAKNREKRPIDVILRSSPPGARVSVDGAPIGTTPAYWFGDADGREHEFTFVMPRHAMARYRFVPLTSGVVHARLEPVADERHDENLQPEIAPVLAPDAALRPVPPPPTVLMPDAARAVVLPPPVPPDAAGSEAPPTGIDRNLPF